MSKAVADEYASSLADLTETSKPLINMLTTVAEENIDYADVIVETVEKHFEKVQAEIKLPALYLVDSIIKNVGGAYTTKFSLNIVNMFTRTFKQVDEKTRAQMFELRETWHYVFPAIILHQLDAKVNSIDPAWPIQAQPPQSNIHPLNKPASRIAPMSAALVAARRDPRRARHFTSTLPPPPLPVALVTPNGIKPLERVPTPAYVDNMPDAIKMSRLSRDGDDMLAKRRRCRRDDAQKEPPATPVVNNDVDLRVLAVVVAEVKAANVAQKRPSTEATENMSKKNKLDKFDVLFGNEDVDLRQLPQVDELNASVKFDSKPDDVNVPTMMPPPSGSPKRDWNEVKKRDDKKTPMKLDLAPRAKFAEEKKDKDRLGRPLVFSKPPSIERERRHTMSSDDTDIREEDEQDIDENKKSISIIMSQAKEHFTNGQIDKNQYNTLMYQISQLNEKLKLKEAKQREILEISKRRLKAHTLEENHKDVSPRNSPTERNRLGYFDERVTPSVFLDTPSDSQGMLPTGADSDMRVNSDGVDGPHKKGLLPLSPIMPMLGPYQPVWRGPRGPRGEKYGHSRFRTPVPPYFREKFDKIFPRVPSEPAVHLPGLDMLASVMPSSTVPASSSDYSTAEPLFFKPENKPGLETPTPTDQKPPVPALPLLPPNIYVNDLFAKLVATGIVTVKDKKDKNGPTPEETNPEEKIKPREDMKTIHRVDFMRSETLRVKQPGLVAQLYGGQQRSGCGSRFPPKHTSRYSQHLDWHFRQNRRQRDAKRRAQSRPWHYDLSKWLQYEEVEDLEEREKSWFEKDGLPAGATAVSLATPSACASSSAQHACALCGDNFQQFYNADKEERHLRNSIRHNDDYYHPACFDDYKASLAKAKEEPSQESTDDITAIEKVEEEAIEINDVEDEPADQSDNESVVEVVEEPMHLDPVEIDKGEEDDVVFIAEPVEEVVVDDEVDTDDETTAERKERDRLADTDFSKIKVKQEPIDPDDEPVVTHEEGIILTTRIDNTHDTLESSIDGNVQLHAVNGPATTIPVGGIRINISRALPTVVDNREDKVVEHDSADDDPSIPDEEPELEYTLKPGLEGVTFSRQPPVNRGTELSGLCSIM